MWRKTHKRGYCAGNDATSKTARTPVRLNTSASSSDSLRLSQSTMACTRGNTNFAIRCPYSSFKIPMSERDTRPASEIARRRRRQRRYVAGRRRLELEGLIARQRRRRRHAPASSGQRRRHAYRGQAGRHRHDRALRDRHATVRLHLIRTQRARLEEIAKVN